MAGMTSAYLWQLQRIQDVKRIDVQTLPGIFLVRKIGRKQLGENVFGTAFHHVRTPCSH